MNYHDAIAYIESLLPMALTPSLERFALFMAQHNNLQDSIPCVHVAGTNGKGSTVCLVESVLRQAGLKTGRYTGPHILQWNERFCINGQPISNEEFALLTDKIAKQSDDFAKRYPQYGNLSWFECLTAMAFFYFAENKIDCAIVEVGLGGRLDATNVINHPLVSAVVSVDFDHMHILGNSLQQIAYEKASIAKANVPMVTLCQGVALEEIKKICQEKNSPLICGMFQTIKRENKPAKQGNGSTEGSYGTEIVNGNYVLKSKSWTIMVNNNRQELNVVLPDALDMYKQSIHKLSLPGDYQKKNALMATLIVAACEAQNVFKQKLMPHLAEGFAQCFWPGRFQYFPDYNILLDGAHNGHAANVLRQALDVYFNSCIFVLSLYATKNAKEFLTNLLKPGDIVFASQAKGNRAVTPASNIVKISKDLGIEAFECTNLSGAFTQASKLANKNKVIVGTGSFATVKAGLLHMGFQTVEESRLHTMQFLNNISRHVQEHSVL